MLSMAKLLLLIFYFLGRNSKISNFFSEGPHSPALNIPMRNFILSILLLILLVVLSTLSHAEMFQLRKVMYCDEKEIVFQSLAQDFEEMPIWSGKSETGATTVTVFVNKKSGTYTLVEYDSKVACVFSVGNTKVIHINSSI